MKRIYTIALTPPDVYQILIENSVILRVVLFTHDSGVGYEVPWHSLPESTQRLLTTQIVKKEKRRNKTK